MTGRITHLNGELEIRHDEGTIRFRIRNTRRIEQYGTNNILTVVNAGLLPPLGEGKEYIVDCKFAELEIVKVNIS